MFTRFTRPATENGLVLAAQVTLANVHDSRIFEDVLRKVCVLFGNPHTVAVDASYTTPYIRNLLSKGNSEKARAD